MRSCESVSRRNYPKTEKEVFTSVFSHINAINKNFADNDCHTCLVERTGTKIFTDCDTDAETLTFTDIDAGTDAETFRYSLFEFF